MAAIFEEMCLTYSGLCVFLFSFSFLLGVQCNSWYTEMQDLSLAKLLQALPDHRDEKCQKLWRRDVMESVLFKQPVPLLKITVLF